MPELEPTVAPAVDAAPSAGKETLLTPAAGEVKNADPSNVTDPNSAGASDPAAAAAKDGAKPADKKEEGKEEPKKVVPEKYALTLPKDSRLPQAHLEKVAAFAKERGFSNEEAQGLVERDNTLQSEAIANYEKSLQRGGEGWNGLLDSYEKEALNDKEIGGSIENLKASAELSRRVVARFDTQDKQLSKMLSESPLGSHPAVIRFLSGIGKAMSDDKFVWGGKNQTAPKSVAERLYGNSEK